MYHCHRIVGLRRLRSNRQLLAERLESRFDLADVRAVVEVDQTAHHAFGKSKPHSKGDVTDTIGAHRVVERIP